MIIEMPVGKRILLKSNLDDYKWFNINSRRWNNNGININFDDDSDNDYSNSWDTEVEYIMTVNGLERSGKNPGNNEQPEKPERPEKAERKEMPERKENPDSSEKKKDNPNGEYRYHKPKTANSAATNVADPSGEIENKVPESIATIALLTSMS